MKSRSDVPAVVLRLQTAVLLLMFVIGTPVYSGGPMHKLPVRTNRVGQIDNDRFRDETGWNVVRRLSVSIDLETENSSKAVSPTRVFHTGEQFRLRITTTADLHVYVLVQNSDESYRLLFPESGDEKTLASAGIPRLVPDRRPPFEFLGQTGIEKLRILASPKPLPKIAPRQLFKLQSGEKLSKQEEALLSRLKSVQSVQAKSLFNNQKQTTCVKSLEASIRSIRSGSQKKAIEIVAVEETDIAQVVTVASPDQNSDGVLVAVISLKHEK